MTEVSRAAADGLAVRRHDDGPVVVLAFTGDLDIVTLPAAEDAVRGAEATEPETLVLDLSELAFVDSSGVRLVLLADNRARAASRRLAVVLGKGRSLRLFELLGVASRLDVISGPDALGS